MTETISQNSLAVAVLPVTAVVQPRYFAVGMQFAKLQYIAQVSGDENAPHFLHNQEPTQDGPAYQARNNQHFYRPQLRVAQRTLPPLGPDMRFLKDAQGKVRLQFELEEAPISGLPADAEPLNVRVDQVLLRWDSGQRLFPQPTLIVEDNQQDPNRPNFYIRVGVDLAPDEVEAVYGALSNPNAHAYLDVSFSYGYWVDDPSATLGDESAFAVATTPLMASALVRTPVQLTPAVVATGRIDLSNVAPAVTPVAPAPPFTVVRAIDRDLPVVTRIPPNLRTRLVDKSQLGDILIKAKEREQAPDFRTVKLVRTIGFSFDAQLDQNKPIYSSIKSNNDLGAGWVNTEFGPFCKASFPNTVYRMPDEIRLAYNPELGTPHMIPTLYHAGDETRVRVTLRAVPWHNPDHVVKLRDYLYRAYPGVFAAPAIVVGGYQDARLKVTSAFPEQIQALGGDDVPVNLEGGFDLTLDLSIEFYRFLCQMLVRGTGLTGVVSVTLDAGAPPSGQAPVPDRVRQIDMRLTLADLANLPVAIQIQGEVLSPTRVQIANKSPETILIDHCEPRLIQYDENSILPMEVIMAISTSTFPASLAANTVLDVDIKPKEAQAEQLWNAVQLELIGQDLAQTPEQVLERVHEVAPSGTLDWKIEAECPPFLENPVQTKYANLYRIEVQVSRAGFAPQQIVLRRDQPTGHITMQRTLREIADKDTSNLATFKYIKRNIYFDHEGQWSAEREEQGFSLAVFPNPLEND
jgi:hypothetical protein